MDATFGDLPNAFVRSTWPFLGVPPRRSRRDTLLFLADAGTTDAFGHKQLGGVAQVVAGMVKDELGFKYHYAIADYLQRSARHIASKTDVEQAYAVGKAAVEMALTGQRIADITDVVALHAALPR